MIIAVDFDGTICDHQFPNIGEAIPGMIEKLVEHKKVGNKIILWTCREGYHLQQAISWCEKRGLTFDAINENVSSQKNKEYGIRKIYADMYIDDRNINIKEFIK